MQICEIYHSIQGEGLLTGIPSVFVRTSGCNLRCWFCDTPYASWAPEGGPMNTDEVLRKISQWPCSHVVLTGGEPLLFRETAEVVDRLRQIDVHTTIETAGTIFQPVACDLMSISPKLSNSTPSLEMAGVWHGRHQATRHRPEIVQNLMQVARDYQLKFVVNTQEDTREILEYLELIGEFRQDRVLLMPQGTSPAELEVQAKWLLPWCSQHDFRYCDRAHIHWFGAKRGT